jgi:hypothetical protein
VVKSRFEPANQLAVVYLARFAEGPAPVANFINSYQQYAAGVAHECIVVRKGFPSSKTRQVRLLRAVFSSDISISDEGFDITAYAVAAKRLPHKYVVFLNTFSEIAADDWLLKLRAAMDDPVVGIAGASGSFESLNSSMKRANKGWWLFKTQVPASSGPAAAVKRAAKKWLPKRLIAAVASRVHSQFAKSASKAGPDAALDDKYEEFWQRETQAGGIFGFLNGVLPFPNPHIRTNAFIIEREVFLDLVPTSITTKNETYLFESGPTSLTRQILGLGRKAVVVGRDGRNYDIDQCQNSQTFRQGDQNNLLVKDNQSRHFQAADPATRRALTEMTWGTYLAEAQAEDQSASRRGERLPARSAAGGGGAAES